MCYIQEIECYAAIKGTETLTHTPRWKNHGNTVVGEGSQTQRATYCMISCVWNIQDAQTHGDGKQISDCQGQRGGYGPSG